MTTASTGDTLDKKVVDDPIPFKELTFTMTIPVKEVLGKELVDDLEARVFQALVNQFFGSIEVFTQLTAFVDAYFEVAKTDFKGKETGLILPH